MQPKLRSSQILLSLFIGLTLFMSTSEAQCPISFKNPTQGTINLILGGNCLVSFDATTYMNVNGSCTLTYFRDASMTIPFAGLPTFNSTAIGPDIEVFVSADDGNPATPMVSPLKFTLRILDTTAPVLTCPANQNYVAIGNACSFTLNDALTAVAVDNCSSSAVSWSLVGATTGNGSGTLAGTILNTGKTTINYLATDASGNSRTCSTIIDVKDNVAPILLSCPSGSTHSAPSNACQLQIPAGLSPIYGDNCTSPTQMTVEYTLSGATNSSGNGSANNAVFNVGQTLVRYTARDISGNENSFCSFVVDVKDIDKPQVLCPTNVTINALADSAFNYVPVSAVTPFSTDNCGQINLGITYQLSGATQTSATALRNIERQRFNYGVSFLAFTVSDAAANSNTCVQQINILDNTAPKINCNNDNINTIANAGTCSKVLQLNAPIFSDNCTPQNLLALDYECSGALDASGTGTIPSGQSFNAGWTKVTYKVKDQQNNSTQCSFNVFVREGTVASPTIKCPTDLSVDAQIGLCSATIATGLAPDSLSDNCTARNKMILKASLSGATVINDSIVSPMTGVNGFTFNTGTTYVQYTAIDESGNPSTAGFNVTVADSQRPAISCVKDLTVTINDGCKSRVSGLQATATDNCDSRNLIFSYKISGATSLSATTSSLDLVDFNSGITRIDCYVQDAAQNQDSCTFFLTVFEKSNPTITCPADAVLNTPFNSCEVLAANIPNPVFSDLCDQNSDLKLSFRTTGSTTTSGTGSINGSLLKTGSNQITYTITDFSGNKASCTFEIKVSDNIKPVISCPQNTTVNSLDTTCYAVVSSTQVIFSDNCSGSISYQISGATTKDGNGLFSNEQLNFGSNIVKYTVTDNASNTAECSFELFVKDDLKPSISCPENINIAANASCSALISAAVPLIKDNCGGVDLTYTAIGSTNISGGTGSIASRSFRLGLSTVNYTATDIYGNSSSCSFTVTVADQSSPTAVCRPDITIALDNTGNAYVPSVLLDNGSFDNCSTTQELSFTAGRERFNCTHIGLNRIQLSVKDAAGNESICSSNVTVVNSFSNLSLSTTMVTTDESYWGATDGRVEVRVSGGTGSFSYSWNTGGNTAVLQNIGAGTYTVTVTDNVSRCTATKSASLSEGPKLTITIGNIISTSGSVVSVPVRVQNFNKIKEIRFSLSLENNAVGTIIGADNFAINMSDSAAYTVSATGIQFSKFFRESGGVSLPNGTALFMLKIRLDAASGNYSVISFGNNPFGPLASQMLPSGLTNIPMNLINGSVGINNGNVTTTFRGTIKREDGAAIRDTRVMLSGTRADSSITLKDGMYSFTLSTGSRAVIRASKTDNVRAGLTAVDALLLQRHILGYQSLNSVYKKIAADVNRSGTLTALDVSEIKRVILSYQPTFRNAPVWRFIPSNYVFPGMTQNQVPGFPDSLSNNYVLNNQDSMNFIAIKTGDINLSANVSGGRSPEVFTLDLKDHSVEKNEVFEVALTTSESLNLAAIQAGLKFNAADIRLLEVNSNLKDFNALTDCKFDHNGLKMAWINADIQPVNHLEPLVTLRFQALKSLNSLRESIRLNTDDFVSLITDGVSEKSVALSFIGSEKQNLATEDVAVFPNPASETLNISHPGLEKIMLTDKHGKVILQREFSRAVTNAGISLEGIPSGAYFISLTGLHSTITQKVIVLH